MKKEKEIYNISFFSVNHLEKMQIELQRILQLVQSERITYNGAYLMLKDAKSDMQSIYYLINGQIATAEKSITDLRKKGRFNGSQLKGDTILSIATTRAIVQMKTAVECWASGTVNKRQLRRQARIMKDLLNQDVLSLNLEIRSMIRTLKKSDRIPTIEVDEVTAKEMLIQKIQHDIKEAEVTANLKKT